MSLSSSMASFSPVGSLQLICQLIGSRGKMSTAVRAQHKSIKPTTFGPVIHGSRSMMPQSSHKLPEIKPQYSNGTLIEDEHRVRITWGSVVSREHAPIKPQMDDKSPQKKSAFWVSRNNIASNCMLKKDAAIL
mmetsp:Transcript_116809/g.227141  ORF Transcript_116809/g.227141 Transcript_116809/m.227141 type:complete len:133 (+) Transcript_116809:177-575(+)